jgi:hypothetical protein
MAAPIMPANAMTLFVVQVRQALQHAGATSA